MIEEMVGATAPRFDASRSARGSTSGRRLTGSSLS